MTIGITKFKGLKDFYSTFQKQQNAFSNHSFMTVIPFPSKSLTLEIPTLFQSLVENSNFMKDLNKQLSAHTTSNWFKLNSGENGPLTRMQLLIQQMNIPKLSLGGRYIKY